MSRCTGLALWRERRVERLQRRCRGTVRDADGDAARVELQLGEAVRAAGPEDRLAAVPADDANASRTKRAGTTCKPWNSPCAQRRAEPGARIIGRVPSRASPRGPCPASDRAPSPSN